jgi:hypothetical protein
MRIFVPPTCLLKRLTNYFDAFRSFRMSRFKMGFMSFGIIKD